MEWYREYKQKQPSNSIKNKNSLEQIILNLKFYSHSYKVKHKILDKVNSCVCYFHPTWQLGLLGCVDWCFSSNWEIFDHDCFKYSFCPFLSFWGSHFTYFGMWPFLRLGNLRKRYLLRYRTEYSGANLSTLNKTLPFFFLCRFYEVMVYVFYAIMFNLKYRMESIT